MLNWAYDDHVILGFRQAVMLYSAYAGHVKLGLWWLGYIGLMTAMVYWYTVDMLYWAYGSHVKVGLWWPC